VYSRRRQQLPTTTPAGEVVRSCSNYSIKLNDDDVIDDVTDDGEIRPRLVRLDRSDQLGFGFSAAGERPTAIRSVIKGGSTLHVTVLLIKRPV